MQLPPRVQSFFCFFFVVVVVVHFFVQFHVPFSKSALEDIWLPFNRPAWKMKVPGIHCTSVPPKLLWVKVTLWTGPHGKTHVTHDVCQSRLVKCQVIELSRPYGRYNIQLPRYPDFGVFCFTDDSFWVCKIIEKVPQMAASWLNSRPWKIKGLCKHSQWPLATLGVNDFAYTHNGLRQSKVFYVH